MSNRAIGERTGGACGLRARDNECARRSSPPRPRAGCPILNFVFFAKFRVGMLLAAGSSGLRLGLWLALALEIERHCCVDEILQCRLIDLVAFVDVDGPPDIPFEAGVE